MSCICGAIAKVGSPKYTAEVPGREQQNNNETTRGPKRDQNETRGNLLCNQLQPATLIHFVQAAQPGDCPGSPASHAVHANAPGKSGLPVVTRGNCTQIIVMGRILVDCPGVRFLCLLAYHGISANMSCNAVSLANVQMYFSRASFTIQRFWVAGCNCL